MVSTISIARRIQGPWVYPTWLDEQGLVFGYSPNGGATWEAPVVVPEPAGGTQGDPVIVGTGGGNAEIAYVDNPGTGAQVFLESVNYAALAAAAAKSSTPSPTPNGPKRQNRRRHDGRDDHPPPRHRRTHGA